MAIIKGVKAADVSQVNPYKEDMDSLAKGIMARENRANDIRNQILENKAAILKDTRDHPEDMAKAQELEQSFKRETEALVNQADRDYSMISRDTLQTLATDYMGKTDWRVLSEAKRNHDELIARKAKLESEGKQVWQSGFKDPVKDSAWNEDGTANNFTNNWGIEEVLDHAGAAKSLYDAIGHKLKATDAFNEVDINSLPAFIDGDNVKHPNWFAWIEKVGKSNLNNYAQVKAIMDGAIDEFIRGGKGGAGNQYYRMQYEDAIKNQGMREEQAVKYARNKVQDLISTYGESEKIWENKQTISGQVIDKAERPYAPKSLPGSKGNGDEDKPIPLPTPIDLSTTISSKGLPAPGDVMTEYQNITSKNLSVSTVTSAVNPDDYSISNIKNNTLMLATALVVENPSGTTGSTPGGKGHLYRAGLEYNSNPKENPTAIHFKHDKSNDWTNTNIDNYKNSNLYTIDDNELVIKNQDGTNKKYTSDELVDKLGDDLFTYDELRNAAKLLQTKNPDLINNSNDPFIKNILTKNKPENISLSTYQIDPTTGDVKVNDLLNTLKIDYQNKLAKLKDVNSVEGILLNAKIKKIDNKITDAENFKINSPTAFIQLKNQTQLNNEHIKMLEDNIRQIGSFNNIESEIVDVFLDGKDSKGNDVEFKGKVENAKDVASSKIGIWHAGVKDLQLGQMKNLKMNDKDNKDYYDRIKGVWNEHVSNLINGEYNEDDIKSEGIEGQFQKLLSRDPDLIDYVNNLTSISTGKKGWFFSTKQNAYHNNNFEFNDNGKYVPKEDIKLLYDDSYSNTLKNSFNTKGNIVEFVKDVEDMNNVINRVGAKLYKTSSADNKDALWGESTFEGKAIRAARWGIGDEKKWRKTKFTSPSDEEFNKTTFRDEMKEIYLNSGGKEFEFDNWLNKELDNSYRGIRLDTDNEGSLFVAHYSYNGKEFEHDVEIPRDAAIGLFGVTSMQFVLAKEIRDGLKANRKMYADIDEIGFKKPMRIHQALSDIPGAKRGQFYIMHKTANMKDDPNAGSIEYHPNDNNMFKTPFNSFDELYDQFSQNNKDGIQTLNQLQSKLTLMNKPDVMVKDVFPSHDPLSKLTKEQVVKELQQMITDMSVSISNNQGTVNFQ